MPAIRMRVVAVALGLGLCASTLTACGAGVRPTATSGAALEAAGTAASSAAARKQYSSPPPMTIDESKTYIATIKTSMGDITVQLDPKIAPVTVNNFVFLARDGYYNNVPFHRVMKNFMVQSGDPTGHRHGWSGLYDPGRAGEGQLSGRLDRDGEQRPAE